MNAEQYRRARALFDAAMEQPREHRGSFVQEACRSDPALREQVDRLLGYAEDCLESPGPAGARLPERARIGAPAPAFDLPCVCLPKTSDRVALSDLHGRWLVLVFYPRDFSLVCPTELTALSERIDEFTGAGASVLGISVDSITTHLRWLTTPPARGGLGGLAFPLASDENGAVSRAYGVYLKRQHVTMRGLFIIDPNGVLQYQSVHNISVGRRTDDTLRLLLALQTGGLCSEDWMPGTAPLDAGAELGPGRVVAHFRIDQRLGSGAFGHVFRAQDLILGRTVALKVLRMDGPSPAGALLAEARAAAGLNHANICTIFAADDSEGIPFIAMEYVPGRSLAALLETDRLTAPHATDVGRQVALGLAEAHAAGVSHGDLKPANVIVRDDGVVKVLDFGLARTALGGADPNATASLRQSRSSGLKGTPAYMAPEQADGGRATRRSDVFSLGLILYEMFTGRAAFPGRTIPELLQQVRAVDPEQLAAPLPESLAGVVRRALAPDLRRRTITMTEIARALQGGEPLNRGP